MPKAEMKALLLQALEALKMADAGLSWYQESWYQEEVGAAIAALESAIREPSEPECHCKACDPVRFETDAQGHLHSPNMRMIVCAICGNKRCPHATNHRNACTNSNEQGQPGSSYPAVAPLKDEGEARAESCVTSLGFCKKHPACVPLCAAAFAAKDKP